MSEGQLPAGLPGAEVLGALLDTVPLSVVMTDRHLRVLYVNARWQAATGRKAAEVIGTSLYEINGGFYRQHSDNIERCLSGETLRNPRFRSGISGPVRWVQSQLTPWRDADGEVGGIVLSIHEITDLVEAEMALVQAKEDAEAANRAKSTFLATMSHEIRTPLNGVLGMAQAMAVDRLDDVQRERLGVIRGSGESLLAILNDILDLSKIEAGKLELEATEFDLVELVEGAHAAFISTAKGKGLSFVLAIDPNAEGVYLGDPTRVRQILYNLISNALKFTQLGGMRVHVSRSDDEVRLEVSDTGIGMNPQARARVFSKFVQADTSTTRQYGGTGLGLSICRELALLMDGDVEVTSELGEGSVFTARLPLRWLHQRQAVAPASAQPDQATRHGDIKVLAAEDNAMNQLVLKTLLNQAGVEPTLVANGRDCLDAWEAEDWDVILMDVLMPIMDGPTATRMIRAREAATKRTRTPIIALTANAMTHQVTEYLAAGMDGHVSKPIEAGKLFRALEEALAMGADEDTGVVEAV
jgi:PAS domain S-box-containing protein